MRYKEESNATYRVNDEGEQQLLSTFTARIIEETHQIDGDQSIETTLTIKGKQTRNRQEIELPQVVIHAEEFPGMSWVVPAWGVQAIIAPGSGVKEDLRTHIQMQSKPVRKDVYAHTGWQEIGGRRHYLHAGGGINANGNDPGISVILPTEMAEYRIEHDARRQAVQSAIATLDLTELAPGPISWTLLAAALSPLHGPVDFAVHLCGRTGSFKSELMSLFQSHYGGGFDARHLPGSWSSTPNALEAQAYVAKNAAFVCDDFVPCGTPYQQRQFHMAADRIFRAQGNQSGRARLTDVSRLQRTMYPRGIVMSNGEEIPEGQSVRARLMIVELPPGAIDTKLLTKAQQKRALYQETLYYYLMHLAGLDDSEYKKHVDTLRNELVGVGHARTPTMTARLIATATHFINWCLRIRAITKTDATNLIEDARRDILAAANTQLTYLEGSDPVQQFFTAIQAAISTGGGHFKSIHGGIPSNAAQVGWIEERSAADMPYFKSRGPLLGWVDTEGDYLYLDITAGYNIARKHAGNDLALSRQTLLKRLKEGGVLIRTDEARQRNTVRIQVDRHSHQVLALCMSQVLGDELAPEDLCPQPAKPAK